MWRRAIALSAAIPALAISSRADAAEYCVTCEGPPAMYRCVVAGTPDGPGTTPSSSLFCISEMARRGKHDRCAVSRGAPFPCPGLTAEVTEPATGKPEPQHPAAAPADPSGAASGTAAQQAPPAAAPSEPPAEAAQPAKVPRTVEELATETVKSSKEGIQKAGEAIGGTAKKAGEQIGNAGSAIGNAASQTWACIASMFSNCSGEQQNRSGTDEAAPAQAQPPSQ